MLGWRVNNEHWYLQNYAKMSGRHQLFWLLDWPFYGLWTPLKYKIFEGSPMHDGTWRSSLKRERKNLRSIVFWHLSLKRSLIPFFPIFLVLVLVLPRIWNTLPVWSWLKIKKNPSYFLYLPQFFKILLGVRTERRTGDPKKMEGIVR